MPYFDSVAAVMEGRDAILADLRKLLVEDYGSSLHSDDDLRWRHVGIRGARVVFVNLMSLEACDSVTEDEIDDQNIELREQEPGCQERQVIRYGGKKIGLITFYLVETYEL
jgi:hypothetical protein